MIDKKTRNLMIIIGSITLAILVALSITLIVLLRPKKPSNITAVRWNNVNQIVPQLFNGLVFSDVGDIYGPIAISFTNDSNSLWTLSQDQSSLLVQPAPQTGPSQNQLWTIHYIGAGWNALGLSSYSSPSVNVVVSTDNSLLTVSDAIGYSWFNIDTSSSCFTTLGVTSLAFSVSSESQSLIVQSDFSLSLSSECNSASNVYIGILPELTQYDQI